MKTLCSNGLRVINEFNTIQDMARPEKTVTCMPTISEKQNKITEIPRHDWHEEIA